jgi:hypothetical protein
VAKAARKSRTTNKRSVIVRRLISKYDSPIVRNGTFRIAPKSQ